jgi:hypothetical protein
VDSSQLYNEACLVHCHMEHMQELCPVGLRASKQQNQLNRHSAMPAILFRNESIQIEDMLPFLFVLNSLKCSLAKYNIFFALTTKFLVISTTFNFLVVCFTLLLNYIFARDECYATLIMQERCMSTQHTL